MRRKSWKSTNSYFFLLSFIIIPYFFSFFFTFKGRLITDGAPLLRPAARVRDRVKKVFNIFLLDRFEKKMSACGVYSMPLSCINEPQIPINFWKI